MTTFRLALVAAMVPLTAFAHDGMAVEHAYARSANPKTGAAFMVLDNHREVDCTLVGVASDAAARVELHSNDEVDGVMSMRPIEDGIVIPAGATRALERGGDHVMLMGLRAPMKDGSSIALTLDFGDCGTMEASVPVDNRRQPAGATASDHGHEGH